MPGISDWLVMRGKSQTLVGSAGSFPSVVCQHRLSEDSEQDM